MFLNNIVLEFSHNTCCSWWDVNFLAGKRIPLTNVKSLLISVDLNISEINYSPNVSLRMVVVGGITKSGSSKFTELDYWESQVLINQIYYDGTD